MIRFMYEKRLVLSPLSSLSFRKIIIYDSIEDNVVIFRSDKKCEYYPFSNVQKYTISQTDIEKITNTFSEDGFVSDIDEIEWNGCVEDGYEDRFYFSNGKISKKVGGHNVFMLCEAERPVADRIKKKVRAIERILKKNDIKFHF